MKYKFDKNVSPILKAFDVYIEQKQHNSVRSYAYYHPSEFGKCLRKAQYKYYVEKGLIQAPISTYEAQMQRIFDNGHSMHERWTKYAEDIGILRGLWQCNNPLCSWFDDSGGFHPEQFDKKYEYPRTYGGEDIHGIFKPYKCVCGSKSFSYRELQVFSEELKLKGNVDMVLDFTNINGTVSAQLEKLFYKDSWPSSPIVIDMKTANTRNFKKVSIEGPHPEYMIQLNIYIQLLQCEYGVLIYECKDNGQIIGFKVYKDDSVFSDIQHQALKLQELSQLEKPCLPPPRPWDKDNYECKNCEFKSNCHASSIWNNPNINEYRVEFYKKLLYDS